MPFLLQTKEFIKKLQNLPLWQRKFILWTIVAVLGIILLLLWWKLAKMRLQRIDPSDAVKPFIPTIEQEIPLNQEDNLQMPIFNSEEPE